MQIFPFSTPFYNVQRGDIGLQPAYFPFNAILNSSWLFHFTVYKSVTNKNSEQNFTKIVLSKMVEIDIQNCLGLPQAYGLPYTEKSVNL